MQIAKGQHFGAAPFAFQRDLLGGAFVILTNTPGIRSVSPVTNSWIIGCQERNR